MMDNSIIKSVIVRGVSNLMAAEALRQDLDVPLVDMEKAEEQHNAFVKLLRDSVGLKIIDVEVDHSLPDCVFVEDPLIVIGNKALLTTLGHISRRPEKERMQAALRNIPELKEYVMEDIDPLATLDGGDVLYTGKEILVGRSSRTNDAGIAVLSKVFSPLTVTAIDVCDTLHLKSVCSMASSTTMVVAVGTEAARAITKNIRTSATFDYHYLEVEGSPFGANCIYMETHKGSVLLHPPPSIYPETEKVSSATLAINDAHR